VKSIFLVIVGLTVGFALAGHAWQTKSVVQANLTNVVVTTSKMDDEAKFYESTLGFKRFFHNATCYFLKSGGVNLVLVKARRRQDETKNLCLDVNLASLDDASNALKSAGIRFDRTDPNIIALHDPDGNLVEIVHG